MSSPSRHRITAAVGICAALLGLTGCLGDPDLWARYHAERLLWKARRTVAIADFGLNDPQGGRIARAASALEQVVGAFPPERWARGPALHRARARDVAQLSGTAALLRARLDERAGNDESAEARFARAADAYAAIDSVAVAARAGRAQALERLGQNAAAAAMWVELAQHAAELDSAGVAPWSVRLEAPAEAVRILRLIDRPATADSVREAATTRLAAAAARRAGQPLAGELWGTIAQLQRRSGRYFVARSALRAALMEPGGEQLRPARVLELAVLSREAREPDSTVVYSGHGPATTIGRERKTNPFLI